MGSSSAGAAVAARDPQREQTKPAFRPDIEGLRAIAVLFVLIWHAGIPWLPGGFVGVDVFFVVSGFLMTSILHREQIRLGRIKVAEFYARRARRLVPASTVTLLAISAGTILVLPATRWHLIGTDVAAAGGYMLNWRLAERAVNYFSQDIAPSPVQHFWSLSVEEQFYIFWPLLLIVVAWIIKLLGRGSATVLMFAALAVIAASSLGWCISLTGTDATRAYFVTPARLWELALGGLVALTLPFYRKVPKFAAAGLAWIGVAVIAATGFILTADVPFPGSVALIPTVSAALVIAAGEAAGDAGPVRIFANKPVQWVGGCSYSLYLWHWPVLVIGGYWITDGIRDISLFEGVALVSLSVLPAWLSLRFVENPVRVSRRLTASVKKSLALAAAGITLTVLAGLLVAVAAPKLSAMSNQYRYTPPEPGSAGAEVLGDNPMSSPTDTVPTIFPSPEDAFTDTFDEDRCQRSYKQSTPKFCVYGDLESTTEVALVGDSHAGQWIPALKTVAAERGWKLTVSTKGGCPYLDINVFSMNLNRVYSECVEWNKQMTAYLTGPAKPDAVITSYGVYQVEESALVAGAEARWDPLIKQGNGVIVIRDTPQPGMNLADCVSGHLDELEVCAVARDRALGTRDQSQPAAVNAVPGVELVDLTDWICPTETCAPVIGGVLVFRDNTHLTSVYTRSLTRQLSKALAGLPSP